MKAGIPQEELMRVLRELPEMDHEAVRARRIRDGALGLLARRRRRSVRWTRLHATYSRIVEPAVVGVLSLGFVAWTVIRSMEVLQSVHGGFFWP